MEMQPLLPGLDLQPLFQLAVHHLILMLRVGSFMVAAPFFGARYLPLQVRIVVSVVLPLPLQGLVPLPPVEQIAALTGVTLVLGELVLGLAVGTVLMLFFAAAAKAGDQIANTAGLGFAAQFDPSAGAQTPVVSQFFSMLLVMLFVSTDSHLTALRIVLDSYQAIPPGQGFDAFALVSTGVATGAALFVLALKLTLPVATLLLLLNLAVGVLTRSAPQFNVFSFGFPLTMTATLLMLLITAPRLGTELEGLIDMGLAAISGMLGTGHGG